MSDVGNPITRGRDTMNRGSTWTTGLMILAVLSAATLLAVVLAWPAVRLTAGEGTPAAGGTQPGQPADKDVAAGDAQARPAATARNSALLTLLADDRKVVGWISGTKSYVGREVAIQYDGGTQAVIVQEGNLFTWYYKAKPAAELPATFTVDNLSQTIRLSPPATLEPSVFFVVDRTAYRPGQKLQFAAFLRKLDELNRFVPLANQAVKVQITSEKKKTTAAELALASDGFGRVIGVYQFSEGDVLDSYLLTIPGYKGAAKVTLAEYRKSKIRLTITGKVEESAVKIGFNALDFLNQAVPGSKVRFTAQVVRRAVGQTKSPLKAEEFVYHQPLAALGLLPDAENASEEELLVWEAEPGFVPSLGGDGAVLAQSGGDVDLATGKGEHVLPIRREWMDAHHAVLVQGVLTDSNGREQQAGEQISLGRAKAGDAFSLAAEKRYYDAGEVVQVKCDILGRGLHENILGEPMGATPATLVVMRLSPSAQAAHGGGYYPAYGWNGGNYDGQMQISQAYNMTPRYYATNSGYPYRSASARARPVSYYTPPRTIERTMVTAVPFKGTSAQVKLTEPGAYMLIGVAQLSDGSTVRGEVGCIVRDAEDSPGLSLETDKSQHVSGETMTAHILSRYKDARVLVTLRDSTGIRFWKPVQLEGGKAQFTQRLGEDLQYGCTVGVHYADVGGPAQVQSVERFIRVVPEHRMLKITTTMKDICDAGENVKIAIGVNRDEAVDLVVSVYDQSLLGIAPDKSVNIANFYLADERVRLAADRDQLRRRLGGMTLAGVIEQAEAVLAKLVKDHPSEPNSPEIVQLKQAIDHCKNNHYVKSDQAAILLGCAGIPTRLTAYSGRWYHQDLKPPFFQTSMFDLLDAASPDKWRLSYRFYGQTLILAEMPTDPAVAAQYFQTGAYDMYRGYARGEAALSMNASYSEGQAFVSHLPSAGVGQPGQPAPELITLDPTEAGGAAGSMAIRRDFSDSAFFNAAVRTDDRGQASVQFKLPDSLTNWQVVVTAVSKDMHVGSAKAKFTSTKPIMVWPMLPRVFTEGDKVEVYASVHNRTDKDQDIKVACKVGNGQLLTDERTTVHVKAGGNVPVYWTFRAGEPGFTQLLMSAECPAGSDASLKRLPVTALAAEQIIAASGYCKNQAKLVIPAEGVDLAKARLDIDIAPTLAADLVDTLDYLVDYPHGCVEQTMSRFLPAIKVAQILKKFQINNPPLTEKLPKCVDMGIKRLLELQQADGGWGWNGSGQTHEMMTPYALYGLLEAEKAGYKIGADTAINRGLDRLKTFIDNMGENQIADRIYCMYIYSHRRAMDPSWWAFITTQLDKKKLSHYALALSIEMAVEAEKKDLAKDLAGELRRGASQSAGLAWWTTAGFSRWGDDPFEITAEAMRALVAVDPDSGFIPDALAYFAQGKRGNHWNSTKDTAMIVFAMCDYLARQDMDIRGGKTFALTVNNGRKIPVKVEGGLSVKVTLDGKDLQRGDNVVAFDGAPAGCMYRLCLRYHKAGRDIPPMANGITVTRNFYLLDDKGARVRAIRSGEALPRGCYIESEVDARRVAGNEMRYVLVDNPKPATCEILPADDIRYRNQAVSTAYVLREDKTATVLYHHEQTAAQIVDRCVLHAELAGDYAVAPATVELMYQTDLCGHSGTFAFTVKDDAPAVSQR